MVSVTGGHPELSELCTYLMQHHQTARWKLIGSLLGLPLGQLEIIDHDCKGKAEDCSTAMLAQWLSIDTTASWEKFKKIIENISQPTFPSVDFSIISNVKVYLQQRYYDDRYTRPLKVCMPYKSEHFTNIAFIQHKHSEVTEESITAVANVMHSGDIIIDDDRSYHFLPQSLKYNDYYNSCKKSTEVFEFLHAIDSVPDRKPFFLLIEGAPGMGKTIVCKEIALRLSKHQNIELIFLLNLHEIYAQTINSFDDFFESVCPGKQQRELKNVSHYLSTTKGKKVLVIIDGYEQLFSEPNCNSSSYIMGIVTRKVLKFQLCDLIVSTRHVALIDLEQYENWFRIELLGFTEELQHQYLECSLRKSKSENDIVQLKNCLKSNSILHSLCFCPLFMNYLISLYDKLKGLPTFQTELVNKFVCVMILWNLRNQQVPSILDITSLFEKLPKEYQNNVNEISKLAFYALKEGKVVFELQKVFNRNVGELAIELEPSSCYQRSLGFVKAFTLFGSSGSKTIVTLCFPLIQELFSSFFVVQSGNHVMRLWTETEWSSKYINVWAFYFGLTKAVRKEFNEIMFATQFWRWSSKKLSSKILQDKIKCLYLVYCLMELPDEEIYQQVKEVILENENFLDLSNFNLNVEGLYVIISFLSCYVVRQWDCFSICHCNLDDNALSFLQGRVKYIAKVEVFDLSSNQLTVKSVMQTFKIVHIMNASKVILSHNKDIKNKDICKYLVSHTKPSFHVNLRIVENDKTLFLMNTLELCTLQSMTTLTSLYIIKCSLDVDKMMPVLREHKTLSLVFLYDNKLLHYGLLKFLEEIKNLKNLKNLLIFEKALSDAIIDEISLTISESFTLNQILLVSTNKLLAQGATDHQILMALEYNPSIVHLQLNYCAITDELINKIAEMLNRSPQPWSLLDLSGNKVVDDTLRKVCDKLDDNCAVNSVKLASNTLASLSLIAELIQYLNPKVIDISKNCFTNDVSGMFVAERLFAHGKQFYLTLTCDDDNALLCHKLNHTAINVGNIFTQLVIHDSTISGEMLLRSLDKNNTLTFMHLSHVKWSGEKLYNLAEFLKKDILISICENIIPGEILHHLVYNFDNDVSVSRIIFASDIFIANKCSYDILKDYLTQKYLPLPSSAHIFYVRNCLLENEPPNSNVISDYFSKQTIMAEIVLCNNGLNENSVCRMIKTLQQFNMLKSIFICELRKQFLGNKIVMYLFNSLNCSLMIIDEKVVIGKQATLLQIDRCLKLVSPITTSFRFISCNFGNEHYTTLLDVLYHHSTLEEFLFYECNTNEVRTNQLAETLQQKCTLTSLLLSCTKIPPVKADSIAVALSTVINNNPTLEKVSFKFDNLPPSACARIFQALSSIRRLKHFRFCDGKVTTKEAKDHLKKIITNNLSLEILNLRNNKLQSSGIKTLAKAFRNICHLKLLALNGNEIDEKAAGDIASIVANNVEIEKLLLYNNSLKSLGIHTVCQALVIHKNLQIFRISHNQIKAGAADSIADVINHNPLLKVVDVGSNQLLTLGVMKIIKSLEKATNLQRLNLYDNYMTCTDEITDSIAKVIKNNVNLKALHLGNNNFSVSNISIIAEALNMITGLKELTVNNTGFTPDHIATMITNNLVLDILDIGDNNLKSEGMCKLSRALMTLSYLKELGLYGNKITDNAADDIAGVICKLPVLEKLLLNNNAFGIVGMQTICKSLRQKNALKILQLDSVGITEEVADDIAAVIDSNPSLECLYLGHNRLKNNGAITILRSLKTKNSFKALAMNSNYLSEDVADYIVGFVTNNPKLEELLLQENSIGATGIGIICKCIKDINTLRILNIVDNNVCDEMSDVFTLVIESNTELEKVSVDDNQLDNEVSATITRLSNLKCLQINCKLGSENGVCKSVDLIDLMLAHNNLEEITLNYLAEEIHFLSPLNTIETFVVFKVNVNGLALHMPALHSVIAKDAVEIVYTKDDVLLESEVMKMIGLKTFERLILVFTKMSCYSDQEINVLATHVATFKNINLIVIRKLNANKYNSDISGIVIIEGSEIIVMFTSDSLTETGIIKLLDKVEKVAKLILIADAPSNFSDHDITEIGDIISNITKLEMLTVRNHATYDKGMVKVFSCLAISITMQTVRLLNTLSIKYYDFTQKSVNSPLVKKIDNHLWHKIFCSLKHKISLKALDISGNAIDEQVAQYLSILLDQLTKIELMDLSSCSLGMNLKTIHLQKVTTLKFLNLSNNCLTDIEQIITIVGSNTELEELLIDENYFEQAAGDRLSIAITTLQNLKVFRTDQNIISRKLELELTTVFSTATDRRLYIYNHDYDSIEAISIIGSLCNINTLSLFKRSATGHFSFLTTVLKTAVMLSLWDQDNALNRAGIIRWLSSFRKFTTIKLANFSEKVLTRQEEEFIISIIRENTQLENILLGSQSTDSILDDLCTMHIEEKFKIHYEAKHRKPFSTLKSEKTDNCMFLPLEFLFKTISALKNHVNLRILNLSVCQTNLATKELAEQLAILVSNSTKLEELLLGDCFLGNEGTNVIANSLTKINSLKHLDLSKNNITKDSVLVSILEANTRVEKLHLQKNCLHSTAGDRLLIAFVNLRNLKELSIDQNIISRNMALKLANAFSSFSERTLFIYDHDYKIMEKINIFGPILYINTLTIVKSLLVNPNQSFKSMSIMTNSTILKNGAATFEWMQTDIIRASGVLKFLSSLKTVTTVDIHNVRGNKFTEIEVDTIATVINENVQLENMGLCGYPIHDDFNTYRNRTQTKKLVSMSEDHTTANRLSQLFPNNLLCKILCSLQNAANLKTLDLSGNLITEKSAGQLAILLANSLKLERLSLKGCCLGNSINIVTNSLSHITTLRYLDLSNNGITEDQSVVNIFNNNTNIVELYIHRNCLPPTAGDRLSDVMANLRSFKVLCIDPDIMSANMTLKLVNFCTVTSEMELLIHNNDYQTMEVIKFKCPCQNINTLTFRKEYCENGNRLLVTLILQDDSELIWNQSNVLNLTGVIRFLSTFKDITAIRVINISGTKFTQSEINAIVTVISKNVKLENLRLGVPSMKANTVTTDGNKDDKFTNYLKFCSCKLEIFPCRLLLKIFLTLKSNNNLKILDLSGNVFTEELSGKLAVVLANCTKLEILSLRDCSLSNEGFYVITNSLKNLTTLKHLHLSDNSVVDIQGLESILKANAKLENLCLEKNCLHSTAGDRLMFVLRNLKWLKELSIDQNIISRSMALKLVAAFSTPVKRKLFIYNHEYQITEVVDIRGSLHNINSLTLCKLSVETDLVTTVLETGTAFLRWCQADALNTTGVLRFFSTINEITTIKLHKFDSEFTELEVDAIASIIGSNISLTDLWLGNGSFKVIDRDIKVLTNKPINAVDKFSIQELFPLNLKLISPTKLCRILSALKHNTNLKTLDLSGNIITDELTKQLSFLLVNSTKLETLLLRNCSLRSIGMHTIASSISNITTLKHLSLSWDNINEEAADYIVTMIESNTRLEQIFLDGSLKFVSNCCQLLTAVKQLINLELLQIDCEAIAMDVSNELVKSIINNSKFKCLILMNYSLQCTGVIKFKNKLRDIKSLILIRTTGQDLPSVTASVGDGKIIVTWSQENVLASTGILRVITVAFKETLASIVLVNFTFTDYNVIDADVDEIMTLIASFTKLEELGIGGYSTALQNLFFNSSETFSNLIKLDLTLSRVHANAVAKLPTFLLNHLDIQELHLNYCLFKPSHLVEIINALKTRTVLQTLGLFNVNITDVLGITDGIKQVLLKNQSINKFYIGNNWLQATGMIKLLGALRQLHCLTELSIGGNIFDEICDNVMKTRLYDFVVDVITNNLKLELLGIDYVCTHADGAEKVVKALQSLSCLKVLDISGNNINEEVTDVIATVFRKNPNLIKLFVGNNNIGIIGISKIADALANRRGLEALDISNNNITSGAAEDISKIIKSNPELKSLYLGQESIVSDEHNKLMLNNVSSAVSTMMLSKVFIKVQTVLIKQYSKALVTQFYTHCITRSSIFCCKVFSENIELRSIFNYNKLQSEGTKAISKALTTIKSLEVLGIENNDITDEAADDLATALASNTGIKQFWVGQNNFTPSGISAFLQPLLGKLQLPLSQPLLGSTSEEDSKPTTPTLQILDLSHSNLSQKTAIDISAVLLRNCYTIRQLWLEGNKLSAKSIKIIAGSLEKCTNLSVLSLRDNGFSNEEIVYVLSEALSNKFDLQQLYLGNNQLEDRGMIKITEALNTTCGLLTLDLMNNNISEAAADALATVITSCKQLEQLYLGDNKLRSTGTIKIATAIQQAACRPTLRVLDLSNNGIGSDERVADEISRAVDNTELLTVLILDDNALSVDGLLKITRSLGQSESAEYMMIFSVMRNDVMISEEAKDEMRAVMADQQLTDCVMYF